MNLSYSSCTRLTTCSERAPYLNGIRKASAAFPDLAYLASWMEVSTCLIRHEHLSTHESERGERAHRVRVTQVDLKQGQAPITKEFTDVFSLAQSLEPEHQEANNPNIRIYIVEDLSRDVIELLGSTFNVDPHVFRYHVNDFMWNTITGDGPERKHLDLVTRKWSHFTLPYLRPRYYRITSSFEKATQQAEGFNVLRQLDSDRSWENMRDEKGAAVTLMRAKVSLWTKPRSSVDQGVIGSYSKDKQTLYYGADECRYSVGRSDTFGSLRSLEWSQLILRLE